MAFTSVLFFGFLAGVFLLYWQGERRYQNALLLVASYVFYGCWDWRFLSLIAFSSAVDYLAGLRISEATRRGVRRFWLGLSLTCNLGLLATFKYLDFFITSFGEMATLLGLQVHPHTLGLILPVGISFYTFQSLSYTIDIYRKQLRPTRDPVAFFAFVAFFPQLVAGPIERASRLLTQFDRDRLFKTSEAKDGLRQILYGLLIKMVIADNLAPAVDQSYGSGTTSGLQYIIATHFFAFQIYADFAGYSHIAIGTARLFGFELQRNFNLPYFSKSPTEFWNRWHISLSTWFRDYVYIPLGGNRHGKYRQRFNLIATFVLSGLWHGAAFTFIAWGLFHSLLVMLWPRENQKPSSTPTLTSWKDFFKMVVTFQAITIGWIFFRAAHLDQVWKIFNKVVSDGLTLFSDLSPLYQALWDPGNRRRIVLVLAFVLFEWWRRRYRHGLALGNFPIALRWSAYYAAVSLILILGYVKHVPFIYFQF